MDFENIFKDSIEEVSKIINKFDNLELTKMFPYLSEEEVTTILTNKGKYKEITERFSKEILNAGGDINKIDVDKLDQIEKDIKDLKK